jgi:hypothetical protein
MNGRLQSITIKMVGHSIDRNVIIVLAGTDPEGLYGKEADIKRK